MDSKIRLHVPSPINTGKYHRALKEETSQRKSALYHSWDLTGRNISVSISISMSIDEWIYR